MFQALNSLASFRRWKTYSRSVAIHYKIHAIYGHTSFPFPAQNMAKSMMLKNKLYSITAPRVFFAENHHDIPLN